jgi:hypothetical protein
LSENNRFLFGAGIGDVKDLLKEKYEQNRLSPEVIQGNSHVHKPKQRKKKSVCNYKK